MPCPDSPSLEKASDIISFNMINTWLETTIYFVLIINIFDRI